jgi:hypothetical protein
LIFKMSNRSYLLKKYIIAYIFRVSKVKGKN